MRSKGWARSSSGWRLKGENMPAVDRHLLPSCPNSNWRLSIEILASMTPVPDRLDIAFCLDRVRASFLTKIYRARLCFLNVIGTKLGRKTNLQHESRFKSAKKRIATVSLGFWTANDAGQARILTAWRRQSKFERKEVADAGLHIACLVLLLHSYAAVR